MCLPLLEVIVHDFDQFRWLFAQEIAATAVKVPSKSARPLRCSKGAVEGSDYGHGRPISFPPCGRPFRWRDAIGNPGHGMPAEAAVACSSSASSAAATRWPRSADLPPKYRRMNRVNGGDVESL